jgi:hypothetical protein
MSSNAMPARAHWAMVLSLTRWQTQTIMGMVKMKRLQMIMDRIH